MMDSGGVIAFTLAFIGGVFVFLALKGKAKDALDVLFSPDHLPHPENQTTPGTGTPEVQPIPGPPDMPPPQHL